MATIDVVSEGPAALGESPVWSVAESVLYWVDIEGHTVHRYDPSIDATTSVELRGRPGSLVLTPQPGRLVVAVEHQLVLLEFEAGTTRPWLDLEAGGTGNRLNDGRCDPAGRYVVGSMFADTSAGHTTGMLHRVSADGSVERLREGIGVANGLAFDADRGRMYFADTPTERVVVFDYDADTGAISGERTFLDYADLPGKPDGACLDADGCYWSASVHGWAVIRVTPDGKIDRRIEVPVQKPSMPAFGGTDLTTLYVTTIGDGGTVPPEPGRHDVLPGSLLAIDPGAGVQGIAEPVFAVV